MKRDAQSILAILLVAILLPLGASAAPAQRRAPAKAPAKPAPPPPAKPLSVYDRGYQQGYTAGFKQGQEDWNGSRPQNMRNSAAYQNREQNYDPRQTAIEEYEPGYDLGLELGYADGYYGRTANTAVPANGAVMAKAAALANARRGEGPPRDRRTDDSPPRTDSRNDSRNDTRRPAGRPPEPLNIPSGISLNLRLNSQIDSKKNRAGDRFTATVVTPGPYEGATVDGHIDKLNPSGKVTGRTEMALAFDAITLRDGRSADFTASLEKIIESETIKEVDEEGNVKTGSRTKDSQTRGAIGGAAGAIIGGIAGGVKGAVLGAIIGGAAGVGTVYIEGNKSLVLDPGTEMVIRTEHSRAR